MTHPPTGTPPASVAFALRIEGFVAFFAALAGYHALGGSWWVFAALFLAPDLSMLGMLHGPRTGARAYNLAHTYASPALLALAGWAFDAHWALSAAVAWVAHIGLDRGIGYGLKYPGSFRHTHLGIIGKAKGKAYEHADAS